MQQHYFIGIRIPEHLQKISVHYLDKFSLRERYKVVSHPDDLHITLFYLGACDDRKIQKLTGYLSSLSAAHSSFVLHVDGFNFFGPSSGPRVTYLSVTKSRELAFLQQEVSKAVTEVSGLPSKDRFVPHVTIAKKRKSDERLDLFTESIDPVQFRVDEFHLFTIHPSREQKYEAIETFPLS